MKYFIIDSLSPFIDPNSPPQNLSKIPFEQYEEIENPTEEFNGIINRFKLFIKKIKQIGYNAISLDDLAHIVVLDFFDQKLKNKLKHFQNLYSELISICNEEKIMVFINFDVFYFNKDIKRFSKGDDKKILQIIEKSLYQLFKIYNVKGVITRIGECDGVDVNGFFKSQLIIKTPNQANYYLRNLLPLFENNDKEWIFRTWTIGYGKIGDLIWNKQTFQKVFSDINSPNLIISMKYGVADFFQNLKLNPLFNERGYKKIIELQAKREYDLFGKLPFYTGFQYEAYYKSLKNDPELSGIMVWCQSGGWAKNNQITFFENSSEYVELNTISTINIFKGSSATNELNKFYKNDLKKGLFVKRYNEIYKEIVYPKEKTEYYFNKIYVPPILWFYWNNVSVNAITKAVVTHIYKGSVKIDESEFDSLYKLGKKCNLNDLNHFYIETLKVLYAVRKYFHDDIDLEVLKQKIENYSSQHQFLQFSISENRDTKLIKTIISLTIRDRQDYYLKDRLFLNKLIIKFIYRILKCCFKNDMPEFVDKQAVPLFKIIQ